MIILKEEILCKYCGKPTRIKYSKVCGNCSRKLKTVRKLKQILNNLVKPDLVEDIRCKDCLHSDEEIIGINEVFCRKHKNWVDKEGFCSEAESEVKK